MTQDAERYQKYLEGDDSGIVEIINEYKDPLILFLCGMTHDVRLAEEATQQTFFTLAAKRPCFDGKSSFKTWIFAIAKNIASKEIRKNRYEIPFDEASDIDADECDIEEKVIVDERCRTIRRALAKLPEEYSAVLYLIYIEGMSNTDAAKVMKKNNRQIENLLYRAKGAMRRKLNEEGFTYENL